MRRLIPNLGLWFNSSFSFMPHIQFIGKSHCFHLQNVSGIHSPFTMLIQVTVNSYLDYCNSFLTDHPDFLLSLFLSTLSTCSEHQLDHVTPLLKSPSSFCDKQTGLFRNRCWCLLRSLLLKGKEEAGIAEEEVKLEKASVSTLWGIWSKGWLWVFWVRLKWPSAVTRCGLPL